MGRAADGDKPPARVLALAAQIEDEPLAWNEHDDGSITIVFCNKGKRTFVAEPITETEIPSLEEQIWYSKPPIIHTNEEAQEAVKTLAPTHKPHPKRKEK